MMVFFALSLFLIRRYDLSHERHAEILEALREKRARASAPAPS
jgi:Na+/melibiose symporter-like transporter